MTLSSGFSEQSYAARKPRRMETLRCVEAAAVVLTISAACTMPSQSLHRLSPGPTGKIHRNASSILQGEAGLQPVPGSDSDRKAPLVERLTGASAADLDPSTPTGASRQEELRQRLRKKTEKSGDEELQEKKEEEEPGKQDWDVVRGLQNAVTLLTKVRLVQLRACRTRRD